MFGRICLSVRPQQQLAARPVISGIAAQRARACSRRAWPRQAAASGDGGRQQGDDDLPLLPGLYLVATPLGNLADFSLRARTVLQQSDLILAENPRHSAVLLQHYGITGVPLEAYHQHNERRLESRVLNLLAQGNVVSLISDAGTPAISDPGARLVHAASEGQHRITTVPGPTAAISALVGSGLRTDSFMFLGFLPPKSGARRRELESVASVQATLLLYVAPHDLLTVLADVEAVLGPQRKCCVARELTKFHEEYWRSTCQAAREEFERRGAVKGEIVVVVEGAAAEQEEASDEAIVAALQEACTEGQSPSQAAKTVAADLKISRKRAYALSLKLEL